MKNPNSFIVALTSILVLPVIAAAAQLPGTPVAALKLADPFGDEMVLQQGMRMPIWGTAEPGARVQVSFAGQIKTATGDSSGQWKVDLAPLPPSSENRVLSVASDGNKVEIKDVLVGEVWICSGQSNMEMGVPQDASAPAEIAAANFPAIRLRVVNRTLSATPRLQLDASPWRVCSPVTITQGTWNGFSAAAYYFGRDLHRQLGVPVGLIQSAWGGTLIEPWITTEGYRRAPQLKVQIPPVDKVTGNTQPTVLYNAMIAPWTGFPVRGAIWYQGESNCIQHDGAVYFDKMRALIDGWRQAWGRTDADFPFYFAQIAPFRYAQCQPQELAELWAAQNKAAAQIPNTGMAQTQDIGDIHDIHPHDKQEVGRRLARLALARTYGVKTQNGAAIIDDSGPRFQSLEAKGDRLIVKFDDAKSGLAARDGKPLSGFEIAGDDDQFAAAEAQIGRDSIILRSKTVTAPTQVRFAWSDAAEPNLMNGNKLPAAAFCAPEPVNLALHAPYTCTNPNTHGYGASGQLTDGSWIADGDHCFASNEDDKFPKDVVVDLQEAREVRRLKFGVPPFGSTKTVLAAISTDGSTFTDVGKHVFSQEKAEIAILNFAPAKARFIRLTYTDRYDKQVIYPIGFVFTTELEAR